MDKLVFTVFKSAVNVSAEELKEKLEYITLLEDFEDCFTLSVPVDMISEFIKAFTEITVLPHHSNTLH